MIEEPRPQTARLGPGGEQDEHEIRPPALARGETEKITVASLVEIDSAACQRLERFERR